MKKNAKNIIVCSKNSSKIASARIFFQNYYGKDYDLNILGIKTDSGVSDVPINEDLVQGAINRVKNTTEPADIIVAFEGGFIFENGKTYVQDVVALLWKEKSNEILVGLGSPIQIPPSAFECSKRGVSLNKVTITLENAEDEPAEVKDELVVAHYLSNGKIDRNVSHQSAMLQVLDKLNGKPSKLNFIELNNSEILDKNKFDNLEKYCKNLLKNMD